MSDNPTAGGSVIAAAPGGGYWKEIALIAALIIAGVIGYSWLKAHDAWIRYQALAQQKDAQIAQRDAEAKKYQADIEQLKKQAQSPEQVVKLIPQIVKVPADLPEPVVIEHPDKLTQQDVSQLPDAPSTLLPDPTVKTSYRPGGRRLDLSEKRGCVPAELRRHEERAGPGGKGTQRFVLATRQADRDRYRNRRRHRLRGAQIGHLSVVVGR